MTTKPKAPARWTSGFCATGNPPDSHRRCDDHPREDGTPCMCADQVHTISPNHPNVTEPESVSTPEQTPPVRTLRTYPELEQRSEEWYAVRCGMVTASAIAQLISTSAPDALTVGCPTCNAEPEAPCLSAARKVPTPIKTVHPERAAKASTLPPVYSVADNDTSRSLTAMLVAERITGYVEPTFISSDMWRGIEDEPRAIEVYGGHYEAVDLCGFMVLETPTYRLGYSPDGLIGDDGLVEVKSRRQKKHLLTILADEVPAENMAQLQTGLFVTGRKWIDYLSYCGGMPMYRKRVTPDERWFAAIERAVDKFEETAAEMIAKYAHVTEGLPQTERILELEMSL